MNVAFSKSHVSLLFETPLAALNAFAQEAPDQPLIHVGDRSWSRAEVRNASLQLASAMSARGARTGDRVALHLPNGAEMAAALYACWRIGAIAAPISGLFKAREIAAMLRDLQPVLYLGGEDRRRTMSLVPEALVGAERRFFTRTGADRDQIGTWLDLHSGATFESPSITVEPASPAIVICTTGTTGEPKYVVHTAQTLAAIGRSGQRHAIESPQVLLGILPMAHASGIFVSMLTLFSGSTLAIPADPSPEGALDTIERWRCEWAGGVPALWKAILREQTARPRDLGSLRFALSGGDVLPSDVQIKAGDTLGVPLRCFWASSEDVGAMEAAGCAGRSARPAPGTEIRLVDPDGKDVAFGEIGELLVRSPSTSPGYWLRPGEIQPFVDGWFHSGDLMRREEGDLVFTGRIKDLIVHEAFNVSPNEVESVLLACDAVEDCGVAGVTDASVGQRIVAAVVLRKGSQFEMLENIKRDAAEKLAQIKLPESWRIVDAVPRNALGKVNRVAVAELFSSPADQ